MSWSSGKKEFFFSEDEIASSAFGLLAMTSLMIRQRT